jgi:hypothetical protein
MQKIYTSAREMINAIMMELSLNHGFTTKEITWKTKDVQSHLVVLEIHERIKELLEKEMAIQLMPSGISFELNRDSIWEATIQGDGAESYYFARLFFVALARLTSGIADVKSLNCSIIEHYATSAAIKANISKLGFDAKASYSKKDKLYKINIPISGMTITFANSDIDLLCKGIGLQLRGCFKKE